MNNPFIVPSTTYSRAYDYFYCHDCDTIIQVPIGVTDKTEIQCPICGKPAKISTINRKKLYIDLYKAGKTPSEIAEKTGVTEQTVRNNIIKHFMTTGDDFDISRLINQKNSHNSKNQSQNKQKILQQFYSKRNPNYKNMRAKGDG